MTTTPPAPEQVEESAEQRACAILRPIFEGIDGLHDALEVLQAPISDVLREVMDLIPAAPAPVPDETPPYPPCDPECGPEVHVPGCHQEQFSAAPVSVPDDEVKALAALCLASLHNTKTAGWRYRPTEAAQRILTSDWLAKHTAAAVDAALTEAERDIALTFEKHRFRYQDIGPIHYVCCCDEPHSQFCDRPGWVAHVAASVVRALREGQR